MDDVPIVCTLTESQFQERRECILDGVRDAAVETFRLPNGYAFSFKPTSEMLMRLTQLVDLERQCCRFLTFKIIVEPADAGLRLEVTGPAAARAAMEEYFVARR